MEVGVLSRVLWWAGYLWALPLTALGVLAGFAGIARPLTVLEGAIVFAAPGWGVWAWFFRRAGFAALTIGGVIVLASDRNLGQGGLMRHELRHFWQARILGPLFPVAYYGASLWALIRGKHAYMGNWFEEDAYRNS